ncbi:MAG: putative ABC transporter permease [Lachnospiraceae bacterium]|nr:putative ABC transporter permease [Lachnospiraceae bacterium]
MMIYTGYELLWLFFCYSFIGWILETVMAAVKQKQFVNRGAVNTPFCALYGMTAVAITIFGQDLHGGWLFVGSVIVATLFEWIAGHLVERIYHERWWDYSQVKWNLDDYVCLPASVAWGVLALVMMHWGNGLLTRLFQMIPQPVDAIIVWILFAVLMLDIMATTIVASGKSRDARRWESVDQWFTRYTLRLGQKIYSLINTRIEKAYPKARKIEAPEKVTGIFAYGCGFHKIVWLFVIGAFLGDITETIFCRITAGVWMSRSSVVWGPFSIVWGLAIAAATILLYKYRDKSDGMLFVIGTVLGGAYEYACSVFTEIMFGKVFWDYSAMPWNLGGRINLLYCFFWGIAAVVWMKKLYPKISDWIEKVPMKFGKIISWVMILFMCCNMLVSCMALVRSMERQNGIAAEHRWQQVMDKQFDDERLSRIYPNAVNVQ